MRAIQRALAVIPDLCCELRLMLLPLPMLLPLSLLLLLLLLLLPLIAAAADPCSEHRWRMHDATRPHASGHAKTCSC